MSDARASFVCWKCGGSVASLPMPLSRLAECPACKAELHVCRMCRHYQAHTTRGCNEIRAEEVINKTHANFCDWFGAKTGAFNAKAQAKAAGAKSKLDGLFGGTPGDATEPDAAREAVEGLFDDKKNS